MQKPKLVMGLVEVIRVILTRRWYALMYVKSRPVVD